MKYTKSCLRIINEIHDDSKPNTSKETRTVEEICPSRYVFNYVIQVVLEKQEMPAVVLIGTVLVM